jgi:hypothetical protein
VIVLKRNRIKVLLPVIGILTIIVLFLIFGLPWERTASVSTALKITRSRFFADYDVTKIDYDFLTRSYFIHLRANPIDNDPVERIV